MKYIGFDVHISSVTFCVTDEKGKIIDQSKLAMNEELITEYVKNIKGEKALTFEEGPMAEWLYNMLHDKVDKLVVCNPYKNALIYKENSNDKIDSKKLAKLLRLDALHEVIHPNTKIRQEFRELMNLYFKINNDSSRAKNRLKATFRMKGIACSGQTIYNEEHKKEWLKKLSGKITARDSANLYLEQVDFLSNQKNNVYEKIKKKSKKFSEIEEFMKIPGVGLITASTFSAFIFTPWRFESKVKLWAYCGLSLVENDTGEDADKQKEKKRKKKILRKLTNKGNRRIKHVLKSAAECACNRCKDNELKRKYNVLITRGLRHESAILSVSRYLANKLYGIWKELERKNKKKGKQK